MTYENNTKYIAEAWIDNGRDEEFKKSFLTALIEQYQGHENGFDADTVDGLHGYDIEALIQTATKDLISEFQIGYTIFNNNQENIYHYLGLEAIKLYDYDFQDRYLDDQKTLPWGREPITEEENIPNLLEILTELYNITYIGEEDSELTNKQIYDIFKSYVINIDNRLETVEGALDGKIINGVLSADSVNGIRFFIYTPEEYAALEESASQYDPEGDNPQQVEEDYHKINSIHNFFIIKSRQEIIDGGYEDGVYPYNPDVAIINKYYQFRVSEESIYNEETGEYVTQKWLQYRYQDSEEWHNLCPASDFIDEDKVEEYVLEILEENTNYILNPDAVENALKNIPITDDSTLPFAVYNREHYIAGGFYDYRNGDDNNKTNIPIKIINGFQYLNLTPFQDMLTNEVTEVANELDECMNEVENSISDVTNQISAVNDEVLAVKGGSEKSIKDLDTQLNTISRQLTDIQTSINNISKWEKKNINGAVGGGYQSYCIYNPKLKIAGVYYNVDFYWRGSTNWNYRWTSTTSSEPVIDKAYACPVSNVYSGTSDDDVRVFISNKGTFMLKITGGAKNKLRNIRCFMFYKYDVTN